MIIIIIISLSLTFFDNLKYNNSLQLRNILNNHEASSMLESLFWIFLHGK